jgi:hypothetical protein
MAEQGYAWYHSPFGEVYCYPSFNSNQFILPFAESTKRGKFHDDALADATREINTIMERIHGSNDDPSRTPSIIVVPGGQLMLVWAVADHGISSYSDPADIAEALGLPSRTRG